MSFVTKRQAWLTKGRFLIITVLAFLVALPPTIAFSPILVRPARADDRGVYAVCPGPILEGESAQMKIGASGSNKKVKHAYIFTYGVNLPNTATEADFTPYDGVKFKSKSGKTQVKVPVETTEDTIPEPNEVFAIGTWDGEDWHGCLVTIVDDDMPEIARVEIMSMPVTGLFYRYGESIDVIATFTQEVEVEGTPHIALFIGDGDSATWRGAEYLSGSGSNRLIFRYRVQAGDIDHDGMSVGAGSTSDDRTPSSGFDGNIYAKGTGEKRRLITRTAASRMPPIIG